MNAELGKALVVMGLVIAAIGVLVMLSGKGNVLSFLGRLPGDIVVEKKNFTFFAPIGTSIVLSIVLTVLFWIFGKR